MGETMRLETQGTVTSIIPQAHPSDDGGSQASGEVDHHGGGHGSAPSLATALASAILNYLLMFGLCCAYGMIMFSDEWNSRHRALGVKMNLSTAMIAGMLLAIFSKVPVAIGGPDLNPVVFLAGFVSTIAKEVADSHGLDYPDASGASSSSGSGGASGDSGGCSGGVDFCLEPGMGVHYEANMAACDAYHEELRATAIFSVAVSSAVIGFLFFFLGRFKITRYVSYVPTSVMEAFLSCVGYKVFKYALKFANYDPKQFLPAAFIGVPLYFIKAMHIGNPAVVLPSILLLPLACFHAFIMIFRDGVLRPDGECESEALMFGEIQDVPFYTIWTDSIGMAKSINFSAWVATLPDLSIMIIVVVLDCLLKLSSTESKLPVVVDKDYEIQLHGLGNSLMVLFGSSVGYMQLKFNVINYGVMGNVRDRRGGAIYAILCGACFFGTIEHFNFLPRFFLSTLLFFAGAGFVAENLWGSRKYLSFHEWMQIFLILAVFVFFEMLLYAVITGGILTGIDFIVKYSKVPSIAGKPMRGGELASTERKGELLQKVHQHIANSWTLVVQLKGFIFFASAQLVTEFIRSELAATRALPQYRRLRYIVLDCELLDGMDASASKSFQKLSKDAAEEKVRVLWSHVSPALAADLRTRKLLLNDEDAFATQAQAVSYIERKLFKYHKYLQDKWRLLHPCFTLARALNRRQDAFEPFVQVLTLDADRVGCPWRYCGRQELVKFQTVLWEPGQKERDSRLFLVHSGAVGLYAEKPLLMDLGEGNIGDPIAVYRHGWFLNREVMSKMPTKGFAIALEDGEVIYWDEMHRFRMSRDRPFMAEAVATRVMRQQDRDHQLHANTGKVAELRAEKDTTNFLEHCHHEWTARNTVRVEPDEWRLTRRPSTMKGDEEEFGTMPRTKSCDTWAEPRPSGGALDKEKKPKGGGVRWSIASFPNLVSSQLTGGSDGHHWDHGHHDPVLHNLMVSSTGPLSRRGEYPEEVQLRLEGLRFAVVLEKLHLYDAVVLERQEVSIPTLPPAVRENLEAAFEAFAVPEENGGGSWMQTAAMPGSRVASALMYSGTFTTLLDESVLQRSFTKEEFMTIGHRASLATVSSEQIAKIKEVFNGYDVVRSGYLDREQLTTVFRDVFHPDISVEEIDGVAAMWNTSGRIPFDEFVGLFARFVKVHEQDWSLLCALRELSGSDSFHFQEGGYLTADKMVENGHSKLTLEEAQEMLWAADWRMQCNGEGDRIQIQDIIGAVLLDIERPFSSLPPMLNKGSSKLQPRHRTLPPVAAGPTEAEAILTSLTPASKDAPPGVGDLVIDLRAKGSRLHSHAMELASWTESQLQVWTKIVDRPFKDKRGKVEQPPSKQVKQPTRSDFRGYLYLLVEDPESSTKAKVLSIFMALMIILSVVVIVLETLVSPDAEADSLHGWIWFVTEAFFSTIFTVEFLVRMVAAGAVDQSLKDFLLTPSNVCDSLAILPFYLELAVRIFFNGQSADADEFRLLRVARLMRLARVLRVAKLSRRVALFGPIAMVMFVIWGIYIKTVM